MVKLVSLVKLVDPSIHNPTYAGDMVVFSSGQEQPCSRCGQPCLEYLEQARCYSRRNQINLPQLTGLSGQCCKESPSEPPIYYLNVHVYPLRICICGAPLVSGPGILQSFSCGWHMCVIEVYGGWVQGLWFLPQLQAPGYPAPRSITGLWKQTFLFWTQ